MRPNTVSLFLPNEYPPKYYLHFRFRSNFFANLQLAIANGLLLHVRQAIIAPRTYSLLFPFSIIINNTFETDLLQINLFNI